MGCWLCSVTPYPALGRGEAQEFAHRRQDRIGGLVGAKPWLTAVAVPLQWLSDQPALEAGQIVDRDTSPVQPARHAVREEHTRRPAYTTLGVHGPVLTDTQDEHDGGIDGEDVRL